MIDQAQPIAVGRDIDDRTSLIPVGAAGPGRAVDDGRPVRHRHTAIARQEDVDRRRDISPAECWPSARARASTTSARPPVLAHGSHSAASIATRIAIVARVRAVRGRAAPSTAAARDRFSRPRPTGYHARAMDPVRVPSTPAVELPAPAPSSKACARLAYNLYWAWHPRTRGLFSQIDPAAWARYRNPIPVISGPATGRACSTTPGSWPSTTTSSPTSTRTWPTAPDHWFQRQLRRALDGPIAYFCAEYGLHELLGIYSGGLGVLAGDHMKTASDMALPFVGVGLLYRKGYFRQAIDADGHQEHDYPDYDLQPPAAAPGPGRRSALPLTVDRRAARARPVRRGLAGPGRPRAGPAARHRRRPRTRAGPADHPHPVRPRPRDAAAPGARARASVASGRSARWASRPAAGT